MLFGTNTQNRCYCDKIRYINIYRYFNIFLAGEEYDEILNSFAITTDTISTEINDDVDELANFVEHSGLLFTDMSFVMEWYILNREKYIGNQLALAKLNDSIESLEKRETEVTDDYAETVRYVFDSVSCAIFHTYICYASSNFFDFWIRMQCDDESRQRNYMQWRD